MTKLDHTSERKSCEMELVNMPGKWRVARKNNRYEFRLSIKPWQHYFVIQYRMTKPAGWVLFEVTQDNTKGRASVGRSAHPWNSRKKASPISYPSPGAAAAAAVIANLIPVGD